MYVISFIMAFGLILLGYFYICRAGKEVIERKYENALSSFYIALVLALLGVATLLISVIL